MERCRQRRMANKDSSLAEAECKLFSEIWSKIRSRFIGIKLKNHMTPQIIRTIYINEKSKATPLVLVHGMGAGVGFWVLNLASLSQHRPVYAFDLLGFARSSRPKFSSDATEAEDQFVESIEEWRKEMKLDKVILCGHSLGGFLSAAYTLKYPERVRHLVLCDPWGFQDPDAFDPKAYPAWVRVVSKAAGALNPFSLLRAAGPLGIRAVKKVRADLLAKFSSAASEEDVAAYIFYANSQTPSGEAGFRALNVNLGWARNPMIKRIPDLRQDIPISMMCGSHSWLDNTVGYEVKKIHKNTEFQIINQAGHHVYADRPGKFNYMLNKIGREVDIADGRLDTDSQPLVSESDNVTLDLRLPRLLDAVHRNQNSVPANLSSQLSASEESLNITT